MKLTEIYQPIAPEMEEMESVLTSSVRESSNRSILEISDFLLQSPGKRARPALVILCGKAVSAGNGDICDSNVLIKIATAVELIHMASLIHDDVLDKATMRHSRPSVNARWGNNISIAVGDYIYSKAFEIIAQCKNSDLFSCMSEAIHAMCEGELIHVFERNNFNLSQEDYIVVIKKKTASLFAASCHAGTIIGNHGQKNGTALKEYGLNFGIAFQLIDDCEDIISREKSLGKHPGQDVMAGDITLPLLTLMEVASESQCGELKRILAGTIDDAGLGKIRELFLNSKAVDLTHGTVSFYIEEAKNRLAGLKDSDYKRSLTKLADFITKRTFFDLAR